MQIIDRTVSTGELSLAVKTWGDSAKPAILALHGWQDNAATFDKLIPHFPDYYWIVPDLPGHGLSEHRGKAADYSIWSYCADVMALADAMGLDHFYLIGHSMGGGIANLLAALFPERIRKLILLDVIGTITTPADKALEQMRTALKQRFKKVLRKPGFYSSREDAIAARARKGLDLEAASLLGIRGIGESASGYYWQHDQRLTRKSLLSMSDDQVRPFLEATSCPVLLVTSQQAVLGKDAIDKRIAMVGNIQVEALSGGHHQHLDGDIDLIARRIRPFLDADPDPAS